MSMDFTGELRAEPRRETPEDVPFAPTPVFAQPTRKVRKRTVRTARTPEGEPRPASSRLPLVAMVAVPAAVLAVGVAGYYATRPGGGEVMAPAEPRQSLAATDAAIAQAEAQAAANNAAVAAAATPSNPPPVAAVEPAPRPAVRAQRPARLAEASRPRPAPRAEIAASAMSAGEDASATLPAGPMPYSAAATPSVTPSPGVAPAPLIVPPATAAQPVNPAPDLSAPELSTTP